MKFFIMLISLIIINGCSTKWSGEKSRYFSEEQANKVPKPLKKSTVGTGEIMIDSWQLKSVERINILNTVTTNGSSPRKMFPGITVSDTEYRITVKPGPASLTGSDNNYLFYESNELLIVNRNGRSFIRGGIAIHRKSDNSKLYWRVFDNRAAIHLGSPNEKIEFQVINPEISNNDYEGFGQTITYIGKDSKNINFVYKEFDGHLIRTSFTQEFSFEYLTNGKYSFKGASFIVHEANNNSITFTPLTSF